MGVGKSTVGKKLAARLGMDFIDCDHELERRMGVSVNTIFEIEGESGFRLRETRLLEELAANDCGVVATGGGVVTQAINREILKQQARVLYLQAPPDLLWTRLRYCKNRPLLQTQNPRARLNALLNERDPLYREVATDIIRVVRGSANQLVRKIEHILDKPVIDKLSQGKPELENPDLNKPMPDKQ